LTYPSEKYESQWEGLSHIFWKIKFMFQTTNQQNLWNMSLQFGPTWGDVCHVLLRSGPHRQQNAKPQRRDGDVGDINSLGDEQIQ